MVMYGITLVPLAEELRDTDPTVLSPFYTDHAAFYGSARQSAAQLSLLMDRGKERGYIPETDKHFLIADNPE